MTIKPKWDSKSAGEYERRLKAEREDDDDIQDYKKPWVDLTPVDKADIWGLPQDQWIEATAKLLKEKNA